MGVYLIYTVVMRKNEWWNTIYVVENIGHLQKWNAVIWYISNKLYYTILLQIKVNGNERKWM